MSQDYRMYQRLTHLEHAVTSMDAKIDQLGLLLIKQMQQINQLVIQQRDQTNTNTTLQPQQQPLDDFASIFAPTPSFVPQYPNTDLLQVSDSFHNNDNSNTATTNTTATATSTTTTATETPKNLKKASSDNKKSSNDIKQDLRKSTPQPSIDQKTTPLIKTISVNTVTTTTKAAPTTVATAVADVKQPLTRPTKKVNSNPPSLFVNHNQSRMCDNDVEDDGDNSNTDDDNVHIGAQNQPIHHDDDDDDIDEIDDLDDDAKNQDLEDEDFEDEDFEDEDDEESGQDDEDNDVVDHNYYGNRELSTGNGQRMQIQSTELVRSQGYEEEAYDYPENDEDEEGESEEKEDYGDEEELDQDEDGWEGEIGEMDEIDEMDDFDEMDEIDEIDEDNQEEKGLKNNGRLQNRVEIMDGDDDLDDDGGYDDNDDDGDNDDMDDVIVKNNGKRVLVNTPIKLQTVKRANVNNTTKVDTISSTPSQGKTMITTVSTPIKPIISNPIKPTISNPIKPTNPVLQTPNQKTPLNSTTTTPTKPKTPVLTSTSSTPIKPKIKVSTPTSSTPKIEQANQSLTEQFVIVNTLNEPLALTRDQTFKELRRVVPSTRQGWLLRYDTRPLPLVYKATGDIVPLESITPITVTLLNENGTKLPPQRQPLPLVGQLGIVAYFTKSKLEQLYPNYPNISPPSSTTVAEWMKTVRKNSDSPLQTVTELSIGLKFRGGIPRLAVYLANEMR